MRTVHENDHILLSTADASTGRGVLFKIRNPRRYHAISGAVLGDIHDGLDWIPRLGGADFILFYPEFDTLHVGADIREFAGDLSPLWVREHTYNGVRLDTRIKELSQSMRTISLMFGDRYGGSVEWPLMAEYVICDEKATIQFTESHLGIIPGWSGILNVMIKSSSSIAEYMAKTGNRINARQMHELGIADEIVAVGSLSDGDEPRQACETFLLDAAMRVASSETKKKPVSAAPFKGAEEEIARRTDVAVYREFRRAYESGEMAKEEVQEALKGRGKPLAPLAVEAVDEFVKTLSGFSGAELRERPGLGYYEADLCNKLMQTEDRRIGVEAVLTHAIMAVFTGK